MQVWEAHKALSEAIGDSCSITSIIIPDGVRYSKTLRDSYLYRAMLFIWNATIKSVAGKTRKEQIWLLEQLMPNQLKKLGLTLATDPGDPMALLGQYTITDSNTVPIFVCHGAVLNSLGLLPLPYHTSHEALTLRNARIDQDADSFIEYLNIFVNNNVTFKVHSPHGEVADGDILIVDYFPYPINPASPLVTPTDSITMEDSMLSNMLSLATLFAMTDSQELENLDRYLQFELGITQQG